VHDASVPPRLPFLLFTTLTGCALVRAPIIGDPGFDAGERPDVPGLDAPPPTEDTPTPPADLGPCDVTDATCDGVDDDCDDLVDNSGCTIGGTCVPFTLAGVAYQSCPAITGTEAWSGACRRMGTGYELASFADGPAQDAVRDRLDRLGIGGPHWIAANDFQESGTYVWWDGSRSPTVTLVSGEAEDASHRCVAFRSDGFYTQVRCDEAQRVLCAADAGRRRCASGDEAPCNGVDDDCDGNVDEGTDCGYGCTPSTFWNHVYYVCSTDRDGDDEAPGDCDTGMGGAQLSTVDNSTEFSVLGARSTSDAWVALTQTVDSASESTGWHWPDTAVTFGTTITVGEYPWGGGEPNDNGGGENNHENCGLLRGDDRFDDRRCSDGLDFICENTWSYPPI
jgi:hypothetical protein